MDIRCIDLSSHQGKIDWARAKAAGVTSALIRAGWSWYQGGLDVDSCFLANIQGAQAVGIDVGVYLYSYDLTPDAARIGVRQLVALICPYKLTLPVAFDLEPDAARAKEHGHELSSSEACEIALEACEAIEAAGYYALLYSTADWLTNKLTDPRLARFDKWVADVRDGRTEPGYKGSYGIWQYSWKGKIDGITGDVDVNKVYRDYPAIIEAAGLNQPKGELGSAEIIRQLREELANLQLQRDELDAEYQLERGLREQAELRFTNLRKDIRALIQKYGG